MNSNRNEMLHRLSLIDGTHLYRETREGAGNSSVNFYKFGSDRLIGPFNCSSYHTIGEEQYDKIINLVNHGTDSEIEEYGEELVELVKSGCKPGMPYIVLDGEGYVLVDNVFNEPEADVKVSGWDDLSDAELGHWCDIIDNLEEEKIH